MARSGGAEFSAVEFEETKRTFQRNINQELEEAVILMSELNKNLSYWAEKTGEIEKMAKVWNMFQNRLATLKSTVTTVTEQSEFPQT
ncbi:uncharacterized protein LOC132835275 [Hemiscyllium ocellatum]|uniref:uncharacterized protein LOC132835275 n=1 Tax=Hemiscyllium ocellatum TaxID=170820 RepID=UPI002966480E|nr:uncharacterized protein LOC132835275 [Hemiscyllium ocellatum]